MNKQGLVAKVAEKTQLSKKDASIVVDAVFDSLTEGLVEDGSVKVMGFGTFQIRERSARKGVHPKTKEEINIPKSRTVGIKLSKQLKELVN